MPKKDRIVRNYYLLSQTGRGSIWAIWLTPKETGANDIYFAGSGYRRPKSQEHGFLFHISFHRDGRAHIKYKNDKIHQFQLTDQNNFPICSIYSHIDDLLVPHIIPTQIIGSITPIDIRQQANPGAFNWCELFLGHFEKPNAQRFLTQYTANDYAFQQIDQIDIGQNKEILILFRFIESSSVVGAIPPDPGKLSLDHTNRLTIWGFRHNNSKQVAIHDLSAVNYVRIAEIYRKNYVLHNLMNSTSWSAILS